MLLSLREQGGWKSHFPVAKEGVYNERQGMDADSSARCHWLTSGTTFLLPELHPQKPGSLGVGSRLWQHLWPGVSQGGVIEPHLNSGSAEQSVWRRDHFQCNAASYLSLPEDFFIVTIFWLMQFISGYQTNANTCCFWSSHHDSDRKSRLFGIAAEETFEMKRKS